MDEGLKRSSAKRGTAASTAAQPDPRAFPVAGVGASAGGLEAFSRLLRALPQKPGIALVLVQHLDPNQRSMLAEILGRTSKMPVVEAADGMSLQPNHVYVLPQNMTMSVSDGALALKRRTKSPAHVLPIDTFLRSLAAQYGPLSIGVVLSGTGTDGVAGLAAIREAGGLTYAQDPVTAEYDGMPRAAVEAGVIDLALDIEAIAENLVRVVDGVGSGAGVAALHKAEADVDEESLRKILTLVRSDSGLDLAGYRRTTLLRRISRRMLLEGTGTLEEYLSTLKADPSKVEELYRDILVNTTQFFRDPAALDALKRDIFPQVVANRPKGSTIRVWVPGCSKGQEAYSLLMLLVEFLEETRSTASIQMFASDVNEQDVEYARAAVYPHGIAADVSHERLARFFVEVPEGFQINRSIRELCVFATHNVASDPPFSKLDLVSLRNVLIYMERPLQQRVLHILHYALEPGGFLLLGSSETAGSESALFSVADKKNRIYRRKPGAARLLSQVAPSTGQVGTVGRSATERDLPEFDVFAEAERIVQGGYQPAGLLLTADLQVLQFRGDMGPYLAPAEGPPQMKLGSLVAPGLTWAVEAAIREVATTDAPARRRGTVSAPDGRRREVDVEVIPIPAPAGQYFIALFKDQQLSESQTAPRAKKRDRAQAEANDIDALRRELDETREQLETVVSERESASADLRAVNERLQSSNEELRTINEEFQTAQEELQSTNEELTTLNDELRNRNSELAHLADDLSNVIDGVEIPILILAPDLRIRRFTPQAQSIVSIVPTDVGRPLTDLRLKVEVSDLKARVAQVIDQGTPVESEVRDADGRWHSMRIRPYYTSEGTRHGVVIAFVDIDELKRSREIAETAREHAEAVLGTVRQPLLTLAPDLTVMEANDAYYRYFAASAERTIGIALGELDGGQWADPGLRSHLERVVAGAGEFSGFEVDGEFEGLGRRIMRLSGRRVKEAAEHPMVLLAIEDVTVSTRRQLLTTALNDISINVASTIEFELVLARVLEEASQALGAESGVLLLETEGAWITKGGYGLAEELLGVAIDSADLPAVLRESKPEVPVLVSDLSGEQRYVARLGIGLESPSALLVPILFQDAAIGLLSFHFRRPGPLFTEAEDEFARRLATVLAFALESAKLYSEQREIADTLQGALLTVPDRIPGIEFGHLYQSATRAAAVGGDFFDIFELEHGRVGILIGDVSGKGVRAATLTALVKNTVRALAYEHESPAAVVRKTNEVILRATPASMFVTLLLCFMDIGSGDMIYCSAGHTTGLIRRASGAMEAFVVGSPLAGAFESVIFEDGETSLCAGDLLVAYTDGVTEARRDGELFGVERLSELIQGMSTATAKNATRTIFEEVQKYAGGTLTDDIAIISVARKVEA